MAILTIEKDESSKQELTAKLDGVELPLMTKIEIESSPGNATYLTITFVVGMHGGSGILIKESALSA